MRNGNSTSSRGDPSDDDLDLDSPGYMRQPPPLKDPRTSAGDEDNRPAHRFTVVLSALPLLQLQSPEASAFPNILSLPVNNRGSIDHAKLTSRSEKSNVFLRFIQTRTKDVSPISGNIHVVLFSFRYDPDGGCNSSQLQSLCTVDSNESAGKFHVRGMTTEDCARVLKWLLPDGNFDPDSVGALVEGKRMILEQLGKLPVHGSFDQMEEFFREKTWDKPGAEELAQQARKIIEGRHELGDENARLTLRRTFLKMIPYQLEMACAVLDGMHRMIAVLWASVGACPSGMDRGLRTNAQMFTGSLRSTKSDGSGMGVPSTDHSESTVDINTQLVLVDWEQQTLDSAVFKAMRDRSRALQEHDSSGDEHTAKSVIEKITSHFVAKLDELPTGCLFGSDDDCPMARALVATQNPARPSPEQRYNQVREFLHGTEIPEGIREAYLKSIEDNKKNCGSATQTTSNKSTPSCGLRQWQDT